MCTGFYFELLEFVLFVCERLQCDHVGRIGKSLNLLIYLPQYVELTFNFYLGVKNKRGL